MCGTKEMGWRGSKKGDTYSGKSELYFIEISFRGILKDGNRISIGEMKEDGPSGIHLIGSKIWRKSKTTDFSCSRHQWDSKDYKTEKDTGKILKWMN